MDGGAEAERVTIILVGSRTLFYGGSKRWRRRRRVLVTGRTRAPADCARVLEVLLVVYCCTDAA